MSGTDVEQIELFGSQDEIPETTENIPYEDFVGIIQDAISIDLNLMIARKYITFFVFFFNILLMPLALRILTNLQLLLMQEKLKEN